MSDSQSSSGGCGCFGCLLSIVGLLGIAYVLFHLNEIWQFVTSSPFPF